MNQKNKFLLSILSIAVIVAIPMTADARKAPRSVQFQAEEFQRQIDAIQAQLDAGGGGEGGGVTAGEGTGDLLSWSGSNWVARSPASALMSLDNMQPWVGVHYIIALQGIFPSRNGPDPFIAEIVMFAGNFAPRGWAFCDGQILAINSYQALFSLLGTTYGGDGRTTFGLPDLRGRVPVHPGTGPGLTTRTLGARGGSEQSQGETPQEN